METQEKNKFQNGGFAFYRTTSACLPMTPHQIEMLAQQHGVDSSIVPQYVGDRAQVSRAIAHTSGQVRRKGWDLTSIKTAQHEVVYGISQVHKDQIQERVDFSFDDRLRWSDEGGNGVHISGTHPVAYEVDTHYQTLRGKICASDWASTVTTYLVNECKAFAFREDGRVYWIPQSELPRLANLGAFLHAVGIALVICEVETETRTVVQQAAQESLADRLQALQDEVAQFDGEQKPSNYKRRLSEIVDLKKRANTYRDALQIGVDQAQSILDSLEQQVSDMLTLRQDTVVKRKPKAEPTFTPAEIAQMDAEIAAYPPGTPTDLGTVSILNGHAPVVGDFQGIPVVHIPEVQEPEVRQQVMVHVPSNLDIALGLDTVRVVPQAETAVNTVPTQPTVSSMLTPLSAGKLIPKSFSW